MTKSKAPLFLTELVIMLLVFSAFAAVCMRLFVSARQTSKDSRELSEAVSWSSTAADCFKAADGDLMRTAELLGCSYSDGALTMGFDDDWNAGGSVYILTLTADGSAASIRVSHDDVLLYSLTAKAVSSS